MSDDSDLERTCTAQGRTGRFCGKPSIRDAPFPICFRHAGAVLEFLRTSYDTYFDDLGDDRLNAIVNHAQSYELMGMIANLLPDYEPPVTELRSWVYYAQVGDLIKIGVTTNLAKRIGSYPPGSKLLASERGDVELERGRHRQFDAYWAGKREWFHPAPELMAHIDSLRTAA